MLRTARADSRIEAQHRQRPSRPAAAESQQRWRSRWAIAEPARTTNWGKPDQAGCAATVPATQTRSLTLRESALDLSEARIAAVQRGERRRYGIQATPAEVDDLCGV